MLITTKRDRKWLSQIRCNFFQVAASQLLHERCNESLIVSAPMMRWMSCSDCSCSSSWWWAGNCCCHTSAGHWATWTRSSVLVQMVGSCIRIYQMMIVDGEMDEERGDGVQESGDDGKTMVQRLVVWGQEVFHESRWCVSKDWKPMRDCCHHLQ